VRRRIVLAVVAFGLLYFYVAVLVYAIGVVAAWPTPRWWISALSARRGALLSWLLISHFGVVLLVSLPFAWTIIRVYGRFSIFVAFAFALVIWGTFVAPLTLDALRGDGFFRKGLWLADTIQFLGTLPALVQLLRHLPSGNRFERLRAS
jgi:hypothetical protein